MSALPVTAGLAWRARRPLTGVAGALAALLFGLVILLAPLLSMVGAGPGPRSQAVPRAVAGIPAVYLPIYRAAAEHYKVHWALLAAIHRRESDFSRLQMPGVRGGANGCGAAGPAQFGIVGVEPYQATVTGCPGSPSAGASSTWRSYRNAWKPIDPLRPGRYPLMAAGLPACRESRPHGCVYDDFDALAGAAAYLHALGAREALDEQAWRAARAYNGAAIYADIVLAWAREYDTADSSALPGLPTVLLAPSVPGVRAKLNPGGLAAAPASSPAAVKRAIAAGNAISDRPYRLIHFPTHLDNPTYDCSSSTSHVLWGAGRHGTAPWVSGQFMRYDQPGPGRWITVYANTGHVFVIVAGLRFDTSRYDLPGAPNAGESGPRWRLGPRPSTNFVVRHPTGL